MLNRRILLSTLSLLIAAAAASHARADRSHLFIDPSELEGDFQFFAPFDMSTYNGGRSANTGFYFEYNRLYYAVSRPQTAPNVGNRELADKTWGDRYDIGYMLDDDHGWLMSISSIDGPNGPLVSNGDGQGLNIGKMSGIELNKVHRLEPLHNGSVIEPFYGVRYAKIVDKTSNHSINDIIGGQLGFRWSTRRGRWVLSNETRVWAGQNFQHTAALTTQEFVGAGEIRFQSAFNVTRDISLTVSFDMQHYGMGIARGNLGNTDEHLTMFGVGFGAVYNR